MTPFVSFFTYSYGIGFLAGTLVCLWLAYRSLFCWRCHLISGLCGSRVVAGVVRGVTALGCLVLGLSFVWTMYLNVAYQNFANQGRHPGVVSLQAHAVVQDPPTVIGANDWQDPDDPTALIH